VKTQSLNWAWWSAMPQQYADTVSIGV